MKMNIIECDGGFHPTKIGKPFNAEVTLGKYDNVEAAKVKDGHYLIGGWQVGIENGKPTYSERFISHEDTKTLLINLHDSGAINIAEGEPNELVRETLEDNERYEELAKIYN